MCECVSERALSQSGVCTENKQSLHCFIVVHVWNIPEVRVLARRL